MTWEYCIVGNGLLGAAVALELSECGGRVCIIGAKYGDEDIFFSGHEDDSRIARRFHGDVYWEHLAERNMALLRKLIQETGIDAFRSMPVFYRFRPDLIASGPLLKPRERKADDGILSRFSHEDIDGGMINPKAYISAMNMAATANGVKVRHAIVQSIKRDQDGFEICTRDEIFRAKHVIDARGCHQPKLSGDDSAIFGKITIFVESDASPRLQPFCFLAAEERSSFHDVYGFHQYRVTDGKAISKFGFSERQPVRLAPTQVSDWFRGGYHAHPALEEARDWIGDFLDRAQISAVKPCAFVVTASGRPHIHCEEGLLRITGCNGMAAKCCQALAKDAVARLCTQ